VGIVVRVFKKQISYAFQQCKNFEISLRFGKVTKSYKVGTFLRHSVEYKSCYVNDDDDEIAYEN